MDYVVDDKTNQFSDRIRSIHRNNKEEMSLTKVVSDIKVINEFSPIQYDLRASYSIMETSLINEFKLWEEMCDVDKSIMIKVEKGKNYNVSLRVSRYRYSNLIISSLV